MTTETKHTTGFIHHCRQLAQTQWTNILRGGYCAHTEFLHEFEHHAADVNLPGDSQRHVPVKVSDMHLQFPGAICIAAIWHSYTIQRHPLQTVS